MSPRTPRIDPADARHRLTEMAKAYGDGTLSLPSPFFPEPQLPRVAQTFVGDGPLGTQMFDLAYASEYVPFLPAARELYARVPENHIAHVRLWTSGHGRPAPNSVQPEAGMRASRRPVIVLLHGWGAGSHWMNARAFVVPYWLRHGYDVAAFVLPFHGARVPIGASGAAFPSPNPLRTNEGFGQAIFELRALAMWLRHRGASGVGAIGMSLGGYTTGLWSTVAGIDDVGGLDFAVAMIPAVSMARLMWRHGETSPMRKRAVNAGITEDLFADAFAVHAPTTRPVRLPRERLAVIAGKGDRITPPDQAQTLAAHWGVEPIWFDGGHLAQLGRGDALRVVRRQLGALGLAGRELRL